MKTNKYMYLIEQANIFKKLNAFHEEVGKNNLQILLL